MYEDSLKILNIIKEAGFDAYVVGGFARDKYLGINSNDVDICTSALPNDLICLFDNLKINYNYYVSTLNYNGNKYEITTFRKDLYLIGEHNYSVVPVSTLEEDLKRRDFIINTLCIDNSGNFVDLMCARADIDKKIINCVKDAKTSFMEDPLRILRAIRFATKLNFSLSENIKLAIHDFKLLLSNLSYDRVKWELDLIFADPNVMSGINFLNEFELGKILGLNLNSIEYRSNYLEIWAQCLDCSKYNFSNKERHVIDLYLSNK